MKLALICGGPSLERGISLNSARSVLDHLACKEIQLIPIYLDSKKNAYEISPSQLYSNTPSDFDFKLQQTSKPLTEKSLLQLIRKADLTFPVMHGAFGEGGNYQKFLESHDIPFVGSGSSGCKKAFDKFLANEFIKEQGFFTLPSIVITSKTKSPQKSVETFFKENKIKRAIVKPASGGSSLGVFSVTTTKECLEKIDFLLTQKMDSRVVIEPFAKGIEFTVIILENKFGLPVALPPTEIETDYTQNQIFDYRKKYLPTRQVIWHCPPRFDDLTIEKIQAQAEQIFAALGMKDFGRFDGWVLENGEIWFCDFNPISGMEQNSFLFQQASRIGMTHSDILRFVVKNACRRYGVKFPTFEKEAKTKRQPIHVLFGGQTSERQVSLMSGTNVWLKLRKSKKYRPEPFLFDAKGNVWHLAYPLALNHTVEEITENCLHDASARVRLESFENRARIKLCLNEEKNIKEFFPPKKMTLEEFVKKSPFIFNGLHGGDGENGVLQALFAHHSVKFNGSDERTSKLCMDKWVTSNFIRGLKIPGVDAICNQAVKSQDLFLKKEAELVSFWKETLKKLDAETLIVKPSSDGCSTGVVRLSSTKDLKTYLRFLKEKVTSAPKNSFEYQSGIIEMPLKTPEFLLFERFITTDLLMVKNNKLHHQKKSGWIEITIGVYQVGKKLKVLNPSITVAEGSVLSVEEKFQGGTGINITPPPLSLIKKETLSKLKTNLGIIATSIGIRGYARIDAFTNIVTGDLLIIEVNTLPALTPSTVIYHQALAENPPIFPRDFLEQITTTCLEF